MDPQTIASMSYEDFRDMVRSTPGERDCPVRRTLGVLGGKWVPSVVFELEKADSLRFGELKRAAAPITSASLSTTLKELEAKGLVKREMFDEMPLRVEYRLTDAGRDMLPLFYEMAKWGAKHLY